MRKYLKYFRYVFRHKWFVFVECIKLGIPIRGLLHDISKFLPDEFIAYAEHFYGEDIYNFDYAWRLHLKRNKHHWQWWCNPDGRGNQKVYEMDAPWRKEMLADWIGAGKAGAVPAYEWYQKNRDRITLGDMTREWIEERING